MLYDLGMKNTIIFDLDGTLADISVRRKLSTKPNGKIDWDIFLNPDNIIMDSPNDPVVKEFRNKVINNLKPILKEIIKE